MQVLRALFASCVLGLPAAGSACDLALALAVDVSGSVDPHEYRIQMDGLVAGLRDPVVSEALVRGQAQLMLTQWSGSSRQQVTLPWTRIDSFAALDSFARQISAAPRPWRNFSTAIGEALAHAAASFDQVPDCTRRIIDLSGDGLSNEGQDPRTMHPQLRAAGIIVNAIAIEESEKDLTAYYYENVILGEGAFVITASDFADYPAQIRRKLLREVARQTASLSPAAPLR
jgi:Ca-activated chloride channel homolog